MLTIQKNEVDKTQKMREFLCYQFPQQAGATSGLDRGVEARLVDRIKAAKDKAVTATRELLSKVVQEFAKFCGLTPDMRRMKRCCVSATGQRRLRPSLATGGAL